MARPTYLELVNDVLRRIREEEVTALTGDEYALLIGDFINDAKEQVEDAHDWSCYLTDIDVLTASGTAEYSLTGSENRFKVDMVVNTAVPATMLETTRRQVKKENMLNTGTGAQPTHWCNNGVDSSGDASVLLYPEPVAAETITFTGWQRAGLLSLDTDELAIPRLPVVLLALAFAARERGEVGGSSTAEYFELAKRSLSDAIAYDSARNDDEDMWYWA